MKIGDEMLRTLALYLGTPETVPIGMPPITAIHCFKNTPGLSGVRVYVTAGLSDLPLVQDEKGPITQELLFACKGDHDYDAITLLGVIANQVATRKSALVRGEVIGPAGPIVEKSILTSVLATVPAFLPDNASFFPGKPPTVLVWLLPLSTAEAQLARKLGCPHFEGVLNTIADSVDIYDLHRGETAHA
jgi:hypothetical protein